MDWHVDERKKYLKSLGHTKPKKNQLNCLYYIAKEKKLKTSKYMKKNDLIEKILEYEENQKNTINNNNCRYKRLLYKNSNILKYYGELNDKNKFNGFGTYYYKNGNIACTGEWKNNKLNGKAKAYNEDNKLIYDGEWLDHKCKGKGKEYKDNKLIYDGEWLEHKYNGKGNKYLNGEKIYSGFWMDNKRYGDGKEYLNGKKIYSGFWFNNKRHGYGYEYNNNKFLKSGIWFDGVFQNVNYNFNKPSCYTKKDDIKYPDDVMKFIHSKKKTKKEKYKLLLKYHQDKNKNNKLCTQISQKLNDLIIDR